MKSSFKISFFLFSGGHPYRGKLDKFLEEGQLAIRNFLSNQKSKNSLKLVDDKFVPVQMDASSTDNSFDTWIFPALQMGIFRIKQVWGDIKKAAF